MDNAEFAYLLKREYEKLILRGGAWEYFWHFLLNFKVVGFVEFHWVGCAVIRRKENQLC